MSKNAIKPKQKIQSTTSSSNPNSNSKYKDLQEFLLNHDKKSVGANCDNKDLTHTRIGNKDLHIYGNSFIINEDKLDIFYRLYYEYIFVKNNKEYLTEKQLGENGPILIDLDFRYDINVNERIHTTQNIYDLVLLYLEELQNFFVFYPNESFPIYVMEKPNVHKDTEKQITKDGIHIIIGLQMDSIMQTMLRENILKKIGDQLPGMPLINNWEEVLDEGISKGTTNWQMYGSRKPGYDVYKLTHYLTATFNDDELFDVNPNNVDDFELSKNLKLLSAQYKHHLKVEINPDIEEEYNNKLKEKKEKKQSKHRINLSNLASFKDDTETQEISLLDITNIDILNKAINNIMNNLTVKEQNIKELHEYTQILPSKFYEPGSHLLNRKVAFALKNTDERLFLSWIALRAKASDFDYNTIPKLYTDWKYHFNRDPNNPNFISQYSIPYWAKEYAFEQYMAIKKQSIDFYVDATLVNAAEWDYAVLLHYMFKDKYVCSSIKNREWYVFESHKWSKDDGMRLRKEISTTLYEIYVNKQERLLDHIQQYDDSNDADSANYDKIQKKIKTITEILLKLKKTADKNNIIREAMEIFYDKNFIHNIDANPYLLCFNNGIYNFETYEFRDGYPQDYVTKCTNISYIPHVPLLNANNTETIDIYNQITQFMKLLFPQPALCKYMWEHLASSLCGIKKEQVFNMYIGSGANGKSMLTDLMSRALGDYKGTIPVNLFTDKRTTIGGASPEIMMLKGIRYAVGQELTKNAIINEGVLKELTGGDPVLGRNLYCDSEIFTPQATIVVSTNIEPKIQSNDDGTWRRFKKVDYISKFVSDNESYTDDTQYVYPKDKTLKEKLPRWAQVFISMLIDKYCETHGEVKDCPEVISSSNKYRQRQDSIMSFIAEKIIVDATGSISQKHLHGVFKEWYAINFGDKPPKLSEIEDVMNKRWKKNEKTNKWHGINIKVDMEEEEDAIDEVTFN
jgi:P4 family phage/plasmid primase-like protien